MDLLKNSREDSAEVQMSAARRLARHHFVMQQERPSDLDDVDVAALDPFLRSLLFSDGTVTSALEARTLSSVLVGVLGQSPSVTPVQAARYLKVRTGTESVRRRVIMNIGSSAAPAVWAESYIIRDRLPAGFLESLDGKTDGIGGTLRQAKLESCRDLLWFGLGASPSWACVVASPHFLIRLYRIMTDGRPALLISEGFAVELRSGTYRLVGLTDSIV